MTHSLEPSAMLRARSLRVTKPRTAVLAAVHAHPHADAEAIAGTVRTALGKVSTQAVYDVLRALTEAGLVRRIEPAGSPARFELRVGDNHHHLICRTCGEIVDVDCAVGARPCLEASHDHGFEIEEAEVIYWGTCVACQENTSAATPIASAATPTAAAAVTPSASTAATYAGP